LAAKPKLTRNGRSGQLAERSRLVRATLKLDINQRLFGRVSR